MSQKCVDKMATEVSATVFSKSADNDPKLSQASTFLTLGQSIRIEKRFNIIKDETVTVSLISRCFSKSRHDRQNSQRLASSGSVRRFFFFCFRPPPCVVHFPQFFFFSFFNLQASVALSNLLLLPAHPLAKAITLKLQAPKSSVDVTLSQSISNGTFLIGTHSRPEKKNMNKNKL